MNMHGLIPWTRRESDFPGTVRDGTHDPFLALHREMNRLFDDVWRGFATPAGFGSPWPSVEVTDGEREIHVTAELPGLKEDDVELLLDENTLVLRGERKDETTDKDRRISERFFGRFERRIPLVYEVLTDKATAEFENGVLSVTVPKSETGQNRARRVEITKRT